MILDTPVPGVAGADEAGANPALWHVGFIQTPGLAEKLVSGRQATFLDHSWERSARSHETQRSFEMRRSRLSSKCFRPKDMDDERYEQPENTPLREQLRHVYWIGGGSGAGKSTIAGRIATLHGLQLYDTDRAMADHARRSTPDDSPSLAAFMAMNIDERWLNRSPEVMLESFHWFRGEAFNMIIEDLLRLPTTPRVIVEGIRLLPRLVKPLLSVVEHAVWLLPTPEFRQSVVNSRGGAGWGFLAKTSEPNRALCNLLERDRMFTDRLRRDAERLALPKIEMDVTKSPDDVAAQVARLFGL
jgi:hypothetical protein